MSAAVLQQRPKSSDVKSDGKTAPVSNERLAFNTVGLAPGLIVKTHELLRIKLVELNRAYLEGQAGFDCGDCADALRAICPNEVVEARYCNRLRFSVRSKEGENKFIYLPEMSGLKDPYDYHFAFVFRGKVYDPFVSAEPVNYDQYVTGLRRHNSAITPGARLDMEGVRQGMNTFQFDTHVKNRKKN